MSSPSAPLRLDCHVHIVGTGAGGTGCFLRSALWQAPIEALMARHIGLPGDAFQQDFDALYVERLVEMIQTSASIDAAVVLAQDKVYDEAGVVQNKWTRFYVPNDYVLRLARKHPEFIPCVSIHPARRDALEELERCLVEGAAMLKLLPNCHGVDTRLPQYREFWERMAEAGLPLLAHTGGEHTLPQIRPDLADPRPLSGALDCGVKVIAAHAATKSGLGDPDYVEYLAAMMGQYEHLYADNSAFNIPFRSAAYRRCLEEPLHSRMLHGSDLPVLVYPHWAWMRKLIDWETTKRLQSETNILERDAQIKITLGFRPETFTRVNELLRFDARQGF